MKQLGLFDWKERYTRIDKNGDPLVELNKVIPWEDFRSVLSHIFMKARKSNAGAKPYDVVLMFKILILQSIFYSKNKDFYLILNDFGALGVPLP